MDHIYSAISATVHDSAKPAKALAVEIGIGHQVLLNKANEACEHNKLNVHEAVALMKASGSIRIAEAMCLELGLDVPRATARAPKSITEGMLDVMSECGDVSRAVREALADNRITQRERELLHREINEAVDSLMAMRLAIKEHP